MSDAISFQCPNCGSSVHANGAQKEAKCEYCGSTVIVPTELRDQPAPQATFSYDSFYKDINRNIPSFNSEDVSKSIGNVAKVTAGVSLGVTAVSVIVPLVITCMILGFVGIILFNVFSSVNKAIPAFPTDSFSVPTAAPTSVPDTEVPTLTPVPLDTPVPYTKVLLKDNFTKPTSGWGKVQNSDYTLEYKNGKYHILINKQKGGQVVWIGSKYTDMSIEVDVQQTAGPGDSEIGVACRPTDSGGFYSFEFNQNGDYGIYKSTNWSSEPLMKGTMDPNTISTSGVNHIEGVCDGSTLTLLLNGKALLQTQDSDYTKGGVGLVVTAGDSGDSGADVLFSNFVSKGP